MRGVDLMALPMDRLLNVAYHYATRHADDEQDITRFNARLWMPPKGVVPKAGPWTPEAEQSAFGALKAQIGA